MKELIIKIEKMGKREFDVLNQDYRTSFYRLEVCQDNINVQTSMKIQGILNTAAFKLNEVLGYEQDQPQPKFEYRIKAIDRRITMIEGVVKYKKSLEATNQGADND